jgi:LmbE family N-acetylglucosaminyl deacetylase
VVKILAIGAHPDDIEFGCAPVLIQEVRKGNRVRIVVLTKGEAASAGTPEIRVRETQAAAGLIGAELGFLELGGDCHLRSGPESALAVAAEIRRFEPEIVLAPHPAENQHPDHAAAGRMVRDAARLARYGGLKDLLDLPRHQIASLYFYSITGTFDPPPDLLIDVSAAEEQWAKVIACHESQMKTKAYPDLVRTRARLHGLAIGVSSAVGLWTNDPIRLDSLSDLTLSSRTF